PEIAGVELAPSEPPVAAMAPADAAIPSDSRPRAGRRLGIGLGSAVVVAALAIAWGVFHWTGTAGLPVVDRASIAVLPFSEDESSANGAYFGDGIAEELTTNLSRFADLFVIARASAFAYKGRDVDVKQIGHELGARYVLHGSVHTDQQR